MQQFQPFRSKLAAQGSHAGETAAGLVEGRYQSHLDRIGGCVKGDRDRRACRLGGQRGGGAASRNHVDPTLNQIGRQCRQSIVVAVAPAIFDGHIAPLHKTYRAQALAEPRQLVRHRLGRAAGQEPDHRHRRPLRAHRERPSRRRAAEERGRRNARRLIRSPRRREIVGWAKARWSVFPRGQNRAVPLPTRPRYGRGFCPPYVGSFDHLVGAGK